jgi:hypothetical protein
MLRIIVLFAVIIAGSIVLGEILTRAATGYLGPNVDPAELHTKVDAVLSAVTALGLILTVRWWGKR